MNKAAQALGRLARGKPKNFSPEEIAKRTARIQAVNERKRQKTQDGKTQDTRG
jgi:hypothetical protein